MDWSSVETSGIMADHEPDDDKLAKAAAADKLDEEPEPKPAAAGDMGSQNDNSQQNEFSMVNFDASNDEGNLLDFSNHDLPNLNLSDPNEMSSLINHHQEAGDDENSTSSRQPNDNSASAAETAESARDDAVDGDGGNPPDAAGQPDNQQLGEEEEEEEDEEVKKVNGTIMGQENEGAGLIPSSSNLDDYQFAIPISSSPVYLSEIMSTTSDLNAGSSLINEARPLVVVVVEQQQQQPREPQVFSLNDDANMLDGGANNFATTSKPSNKSSLDEAIDSCIEKCMKSLSANRFNFKCKHCAYSTRFKVHIIEHMLNAHDIYVMQCPEANCNKKFKDEWKLKRHLVSNREHPPMDNYRSLDDVLRRHIDISLQKTGFPCPLCQIDPVTGQLLETDAQNSELVDRHKQLINEKHENNFLYFDEYEKLVEHLGQQHPGFSTDAYFICKQCGQVFMSKYKLSCHSFNVHSGKRKNRTRGLLDGGPASKMSRRGGADYDPVMESIIATTNRYLYPDAESPAPDASSDFHLDDVINTVAKGPVTAASTSASTAGTLNSKYKFFCELCNRYFKRERDIYTHTKIMHKQINIEQVKFTNIQKSGAGGHLALVSGSWRSEGAGRKCPVCSKTFREIPGKGIANNSLIRKSFIRHMQTQHGLNENGERLIECPVCEKNFFNKQQLERHMHTHEIWTEAKNDDEAEEEENKIELVSHNNEFNDISSAIEDVVNSFAASEASTGDHPAVVPATSSSLPDYKGAHSILYCHECVECKQFYKSIKVLTKHKRDVHKLRPVYRCANLVECHLEFERVADFLEHARIHPQRNIVCPRCQQAFTNKNALRHHMKNVHYSRKYAGGAGRSSLSKARATFLGVSLSASSSSSKYSSSSSPLHGQQTADGSVSSGGGKHQYSCHTCQKNFSSKNSLHNHLATHSDVRLFLCDVCSHAFKTRKDLSRHAALHDSSKHKRCEKCGMTFKTSFHLKRHSLTRHSNIRPFTCDICEMTFARKDKLKQHEAKHVNHPLYKCSQCDKGFYRKEHLKDHEISKHSKQYPFICEHCSKGFVHAKDLHRHIRVRHLGIPPSNAAAGSIGQSAASSSLAATSTTKIIQMPSSQVVSIVNSSQTLQSGGSAKPKAPRGKKSQQNNNFLAQPVVQTIAATTTTTTNVPVNDFKSKKISSILKTQLYQNQAAAAAAAAAAAQQVAHPVFQTTGNLINFNNPSQPLQFLTPINTAQNHHHQQQHPRMFSNILPFSALQEFNVTASSSSNSMPKVAQMLTPVQQIDMRNLKAPEAKSRGRKKSAKSAAAPAPLVIANVLPTAPSVTLQTATAPSSSISFADERPKESTNKKPGKQPGRPKSGTKNASIVNNSIGINLNDISNNVIINNNNINSTNFFSSAPAYKCEQCQIDFQNEALLSKHIKSKHPPAQTFACSHCHKSFSNKPAAKAHIDNTHVTYKCPLCPDTFSTRSYINKHFASKHPAELSEKSIKPIKEMKVEAWLVETPMGAGDKETLKTFTIEANPNANKSALNLNANNMNSMKGFMPLPTQMLNQGNMNPANHLQLPTFNTGSSQGFAQPQMQINPALLNNTGGLLGGSNNGLIHSPNSTNNSANMLISNFNNKLLQNSANHYISHGSNIIDMNQPIHTSNIWPQSALNAGGGAHKLQNGPFGALISHHHENSNGGMFVQKQQMQNATANNNNNQQQQQQTVNTQFYLANMQMSSAQSASMQSGMSDHIQIHILGGADAPGAASASANTMSTNLINANMSSSTATLNDIIANNSSKY